MLTARGMWQDEQGEVHLMCGRRSDGGRLNSKGYMAVRIVGQQE